MSKKLLYILVFSLFQTNAIATQSPPPSPTDDTPIRLTSERAAKANNTLARKVASSLSTLRPLLTLVLVTIIGRHLWNLSPQKAPTDAPDKEVMTPFSVEYLETLEQANTQKDISDSESTQATLLGKLGGPNKRTISLVIDEKFLENWTHLQPKLTLPQPNVHLNLSFAPHFLENLTTQINCEKILATYNPYARAIQSLKTSEGNLAQLKKHLNDPYSFASQKLAEKDHQASCPHTSLLNTVTAVKKELWQEVRREQMSARQARIWLENLMQQFLDPCTAVHSPTKNPTDIELKFKNIHNICQHLSALFHHTTLMLTPHDLGITPTTTPPQNYTFMNPGYEPQVFFRLPFFLTCFKYRHLWRLQIKSLPHMLCPIAEKDLQDLLGILKPLYCEIGNFQPTLVNGFTSALFHLYQPIFHYMWRYSSPFWTPSPPPLSEFSPFLNNTAEKIFAYVAANVSSRDITLHAQRLYSAIAQNIDQSSLSETEKSDLITKLDTDRENGFINALITPTAPTFPSRFSALKTALREMPREILYPSITNSQSRHLGLGITANLDDIYGFLTFRQIEMNYDLKFEYLPITNNNGTPVVNFISQSLQEFINYLKSASTLEKLTINFNFCIDHLAHNPSTLLYLHTHIQKFTTAFLTGLFNIKLHLKILELANLPLMCGTVSHNNKEILHFETIWGDTLCSFLNPVACPEQLKSFVLSPRFIDIAALTRDILKQPDTSALEQESLKTVVRSIGPSHSITTSAPSSLEVSLTKTNIDTIQTTINAFKESYPLLKLCPASENLYPNELVIKV